MWYDDPKALPMASFSGWRLAAGCNINDQENHDQNTMLAIWGLVEYEQDTISGEMSITDSLFF